MTEVNVRAIILVMAMASGGVCVGILTFDWKTCILSLEVCYSTRIILKQFFTQHYYQLLY